MKRDGYIIEEIIDQKNLEDSFDTVVRGTERKNSVEGKWLIAHREWFLAQAKQEIINGHLNLMPIHRPPTDDELCNGGFHTRDGKPESYATSKCSVWRHASKSMP